MMHQHRPAQTSVSTYSIYFGNPAYCICWIESKSRRRQLAATRAVKHPTTRPTVPVLRNAILTPKRPNSMLPRYASMTPITDVVMILLSLSVTTIIPLEYAPSIPPAVPIVISTADMTMPGNIASNCKGKALEKPQIQERSLQFILRSDKHYSLPGGIVLGKVFKAGSQTQYLN